MRKLEVMQLCSLVCRGLAFDGRNIGGDLSGEGKHEGGVAFCGCEERSEGGRGYGEVDAMRIRGMTETPKGFDFFVGEGGDLLYVEEGIEGSDAGRWGRGRGVGLGAWRRRWSRPW